MTVIEPLAVRVWGALACFTRPESKVERVSYPVPTPSAARGILEAIFWKPEFRWEIEAITVLAPIRYLSMRRNEITTRQSQRSAQGWTKSDGAFFAEEDRAQRHTLALRDVNYVIEAHIRLAPHADAPAAKYVDQFRRRVSRGQAFQQPYLGLREFAAHFAEPRGNEQPIDHSDDLGRMFFDQAFLPDETGTIQFPIREPTGTRWVRGKTAPLFFEAQMTRGTLRIPPGLYEELGHVATKTH